mgnify:CR=1 FL=1
MIDPQRLLADLQGLLPRLEQDILDFTQADPARDAALREEYRQAKTAARTAEHFTDWRAAQITQAAAAWVLTCVFVRFLEDNRLLDAPYLSGPTDGAELGHTGGGLAQARDRLTVYFDAHPTHAERDYLLWVFESLAPLPAMAELLDRARNPLWRLPVSADGAKALIDFFQRLDPETGAIAHDFSSKTWDTRFLGDLYQDLSESVRKRYALLQTPEFVESFILDYTLTPALAAFGLPAVRLIDPTCGSGHFLLTAFQRLFDAWQRREPATNARALAQRALDAVHGVDINPYAVAIARFRLLVAAMQASGASQLQDAPDFQLHLAVGDALLHGPRHEWQGQGIQRNAFDDGLEHHFQVEDKARLDAILGRRYHVVVGNPPYITVKDKALNQAYRDKYPTCHRQYSLGVPFTERFFDLCLPASDHQPAGFVGVITANSFMKREFGKKLIHDFLPRKALTHVIDTAGAYIPGHGTPTVILLARNERPTGGDIRAVLGIRGEPSTPDDAAQGQVWRSIVELLERPGSENAFVSVVDQGRELYASHPWSLGGGGASDLRELIEGDAEAELGDRSFAIGFVCITKQDDVFVQDRSVLDRFGMRSEERRPFGIGEEVRDWDHQSPLQVLFPYLDDLSTRTPDEFATAMRFMWPYREHLYSRKVFGGQTYREAEKAWIEFGQIPVDRFKIPLSITFAFVATHNHFVLDRGGKVFKQSAPVIKLPAGASEADHLALLGPLNSSTGCFWMKQVFHNKGNGGIGGGIGDENWEPRYEFDGTKLKAFPIPPDPNLQARTLATTLDQLAQDLAKLDPAEVLAASPADAAIDFRSALAAAERDADGIRRRMTALQEELDWCCYRLYGLTDEDLCHAGEPPEVTLGQRPFEIHLARRIAAGERQTTWFERHRSTPITEPPQHWPADYLDLTRRRLQAIEGNRWIRLVEQPEYKRRWNREPRAKRQQRALRDWLLDQLEQAARSAGPELLTCAQLADRLLAPTRRRGSARAAAPAAGAADGTLERPGTGSDAGASEPEVSAFQQVAALYTGSDTFDPQALVVELVAEDSVPQMATAQAQGDGQIPRLAGDLGQAALGGRPRRPHRAARHRPRPPAEQAAQLKAEQIGDVPLPPKYASGDFRKPSYWGLRGKLDVPKERFFTLPGCEKPGDTTPVIGWAGLDHLERAQAIAAWYVERKERDGWDADQLMPMLLAIDELVPWLKQWHNALDPTYGTRMGDYFEGFLKEELRSLERPRSDLTDWQPPTATRGRRRR